MTQVRAADILAVLPQTQCTRCGYPDCAAYAQAIADGAAPFNQCPPGGAQGIERLAALIGVAVTQLNPEHGVETPRAIAIIDEAWCIGCTLCIDACPTDAIFGSSKRMHTVIAPHCTGCELCLPVCPVDCIQMENVTGSATGWAAWSQPQADLAKNRYQLRLSRLKIDKPAQHGFQVDGSPTELTGPQSQPRTSEPTDPSQKRKVVQAALARARARQGS